MKPNLRLPTRSDLLQQIAGDAGAVSVKRVLAEHVCAMISLGNVELVMKTWEVGEPSASRQRQRQRQRLKRTEVLQNSTECHMRGWPLMCTCHQRVDGVPRVKERRMRRLLLHAHVTTGHHGRCWSTGVADAAAPAVASAAQPLFVWSNSQTLGKSRKVNFWAHSRCQ